MREALANHRDQELAEHQSRTERLDAAGELARHVAEDLGFLLAVVQANAARLAAVVPGTHRRVLDDLEAACRTGTDLIEQLNAFAGGGREQVRLVDLPAVVRDLEPALRRLLAPDVELLMCAGAEVVAIRGDAPALHRIVTNIVTNAREAMPNGGTVHLEVSEAWLGNERQSSHPWVKPGRYVCLSIGDTGVGMDRETLRRVFEPFHTTKPNGSAAGLGMAVVYGLVRQSGGVVDVSSEPGLGTTVKVYFPAGEGAA